MPDQTQTLRTEVSFSLPTTSLELRAFLTKLGVKTASEDLAASFEVVAEDFGTAPDSQVLLVAVHHHSESNSAHWSLQQVLAPGSVPPDSVTTFSQHVGWTSGVLELLAAFWRRAQQPVECAFKVSVSLDLHHYSTKLAPPAVHVKVPGAEHATSTVVWEFNKSSDLHSLLVAQEDHAEGRQLMVLSGSMTLLPDRTIETAVRETAWKHLGRFITKRVNRRSAKRPAKSGSVRSARSRSHAR